MKKLTFIVVTVLFPCLVLAQNLVPNPSFEDTLYTPNTNGIMPLEYWFSAGGSPEYFHPDNLVPIATAPNNSYGYQEALDGIAYIGAALYQYGAGSGSTREYIGVQLIDSLQSGVSYCVSFYVSAVDVGGFGISEIGGFVSHDTTFVFQFPNTGLIDTIPQVRQLVSTPVSDKQEWIEISGSFEATGGEQFLIIGNFSNDLATEQNSEIIGDTSSFPFAYYYFDHVTVSEQQCEEQIIELVFPNVFTPNNDGLNDQFHVELGSSQSGSLEVYNRWGQLIYTQTGQNLKWDGYTQAGVPAPESAYYVLLKVDHGDDQVEVFKGSVQLLR